MGWRCFVVIASYVAVLDSFQGGFPSCTAYAGHTTQKSMVLSCVCHPVVCCVKVFAKFDTSEEKLEPLSAELQVKALPVFKFYKVCRCRV